MSNDGSESGDMNTYRAEVVIIGGGLGGVAAALAALRSGATVILTEESRWLGGQATSQAVPFDENPWIETFGSTASFRELRTRIRQFYRANYPLTETAAQIEHLSLGNGGCSRVSHEPRVTVQVIESMLQRYRASLRLRVLMECEPVAVHVEGDVIRAVTVRRRTDGAEVTAAGTVFIDATELGDVLEMGDVEHVTGSESQADTGEPHALDGPAEPLDQQAFNVCFALDYRPGEDHVIDRPTDYGFWREYQADFWPDRQLSWMEPYPDTMEPHSRSIFMDPPVRLGARDPHDLWNYRRIIDAENFRADAGIRDITLVNWPAGDYWLAPLVGVDEPARREAERQARQLALSYLYWMQTEAPRLDGGVGYAGLMLRGDVVGDTLDGLAMRPYIRESRRIVAETRVVEQHVSVASRGADAGAETFTDSVGIGGYPIDLHPSTGGSKKPRPYIDIKTFPFQIPLGALLPVRVDNLLAGAKNIGTTHITNGCYRLHPVEWTIGEASGALAAHAVRLGMPPRAVRADPGRLADFQRHLSDGLGVNLSWPESVRTTQKYW